MLPQECPPTKNYPKVKRRQRGSARERLAVVSAGPVFMDRGEWMSKGEFACEWTCGFLITCVMLVLLLSSLSGNGMFIVIAVLVGTFGFLLLTMLGASVLKAGMRICGSSK